MKTFPSLLRAALVGCALSSAAVGAVPEPSLFREGLAINGGGRAGRTTVLIDAVEARRVRGPWHLPVAGDSLSLGEGRSVTWNKVAVDTNGAFAGDWVRGGQLLLTHTSPMDEIRILEASGHGSVFVNGEPHAGDIYRYGYVRLPVLLRAGTNEFLFNAGRGPINARLVTPDAPVSFNPGDNTLPDVIIGERAEAWGAVVVMNATTNQVVGRELVVVVDGLSLRTPLGPLPPLGVRKVGFRIPGVSRAKEGTAKVELRLSPDRQHPADSVVTNSVELRVLRAGTAHKRTFVSEIDGSVQYYAVNPSKSTARGQALFLSLHGASVEASGQASAYAPKSWGTIVSPTNRRPYGFDWEDWGRLDTLEVLELAIRRFDPDLTRIYLTGHSMGGHGTWNIGAHFTDRFAAIGPSAGWISFFSYGGGVRFTNATPVEQMLLRAAADSDTMAWSTNYMSEGVYILHGDADDNVPVREARTMREHLATFHHDLDWHEQPGAGHWWGNSDEPGSACVDWPAMFDFFARHRRPSDAEVRQVNFTTLNPGASSRLHWAEVWQQEHPLQPSRVELQFDPGRRRFLGTTENVATLSLEVPGGDSRQSVVLQIDGQNLTNAAATRVWLEHRDGHWGPGSPPAAPAKNPARNGLFKDAFRHGFQLVYGTHGTAEENAWAFAKARFDAEQFWYRGNGSADVIPDTQFDPRREPDRGVILYGNRDQNSAWTGLLADSPVQVTRGGVTVGGRKLQGEDVGCLFTRPRPGSKTASVGVVAGTGLVGSRVTDRLPYFQAGPGYPDLLLVGPEAWEHGTAGIRCAGFFGNDWSVERGEWAWGRDQ